MFTRPCGTALAAIIARSAAFVVAVLFTLALEACASSPRAKRGTEDATANGSTPQEQAQGNADAATAIDSAASETPSEPKAPQKLTLLFAGDIMAHKNNYSYPNFGAIWEDVAPLVTSADLAFANVEAPVANSLEWSTYPQFNMHSNYVEAAIQAGFDVFSLANNHTNDKSLAGMQETRRWFARREGIWACGIKEKANAPLTYQLVEKDGWRILFVAFTQVLNSWDSVAYIDYVQSTDEKQAALVATLASLKAEHAPDLFVVSVHADEVEYKRTVWQKQKDFYHRLVREAGADVVWSNHAHVVKPWELVPPSAETPHGALIMANANMAYIEEHKAESKKLTQTILDSTDVIAYDNLAERGFEADVAQPWRLNFTKVRPYAENAEPAVFRTDPFDLHRLFYNQNGIQQVHLPMIQRVGGKGKLFSFAHAFHKLLSCGKVVAPSGASCAAHTAH